MLTNEKYKILVCEDESIVATDIEYALTSLGYFVCNVSASGEEAIKNCAESLPDLVIMDIRLKGVMTGIEAAIHIKKKFNIPVIFLTAHSDEETLQQAKLAEPYGYLLKPFGIREVRATTEMALYKFSVERKLNEINQWTRIVIDNAQSAFIVIDEASEIIDWNQKATEIFLWKKEDVVGKTLFDLIFPIRLQEMYSNVLENFKKTHGSSLLNKRMEQYGVRKDLEEIPIDVIISPATLDNENRFIVCINDISERRQLEIQKTRTEELVRANRDLERFAHLASHDLQEPLRTMSMYTQLLEESIKSRLNEDEIEMLAQIIRSSKRMSRLVDELLNYSRVGLSEKFNIEKIDSNFALTGAMENLNNLIKDNQVEIIYSSLPEVLGNLTQLEQVFQNLISNAIKFKSNNDLKIIINASREGEFWKFCVKDNGIGFEQKYSEQIFEMFKRVHTDKNYQGTGAGLAICKKIVNLHAGKIWAESSPGNGATFYFTIPAVHEAKIKNALNGMRILFVDDAPEARALITHLLNGTGATIEFAENGFKAIELVKMMGFDLILMDIEMPGINGIEASIRIKNEGVIAPIIAFTNTNLSVAKQNSPEKVFVDFISKSTHPQVLIDQLHMWHLKH